MASFKDQDLTDAEFRECDLTRARLIGVVMQDAVIDGLVTNLVVNGVEVTSYVEAELDRRHPVRLLLRSADPADLRQAARQLRADWATTIERLRAMPSGLEHQRVGGEWSPEGWKPGRKHALRALPDAKLSWPPPGRPPSPSQTGRDARYERPPRPSLGRADYCERRANIRRQARNHVRGLERLGYKSPSSPSTPPPENSRPRGRVPGPATGQATTAGKRPSRLRANSMAPVLAFGRVPRDLWSFARDEGP